MFIDEVTLKLKGGHGGAGKVSFYPPPMRGPDGGNGGKGGDLYIKTTSDLTALKRFSAQKEFEAGKGEMGGDFKKIGKNGADLELLLPVGAVLTDLETGEELTLEQPNQRILICAGGLGGRGNAMLAHSRRTTPEFAQGGREGEEKNFKVDLKLIADFGLIGLPNAGKSSLLNELTRSSAKVANYPFTTLEPNLGVLKLGEKNVILADIPGLIEGASVGKGLGIKFLKHIEKTHTLLHCLDLTSEDVINDFQTVMQELKEYNPQMLAKRQIILLTKSDMVDQQKIKEAKNKLKKITKSEVLVVSIHDYDSLEALKKLLSESL